MKRGMRLISRVAATATLLLAGMIPSSPDRAPTSPATATAPDAVARYEVRLRKLHLVRPDLIHYPIQYDVYC